MLMALIYFCAFVYFGAMVSFPASNEADVVMAFVTQNVNALWIAYFTIYVVFGVLLDLCWLLVIRLNQKTKKPIDIQLFPIWPRVPDPDPGVH